jgi:hypothetical protein
MSDDDTIRLSECEGAQRSGLLLYPPFLAPCGCWDDLFLPIGTAAALAKQIAKKAFKKQLAKRAIIILSKRISIRQFAINTAKNYESIIIDRIKFYKDEILRLKSEIKKATSPLLTPKIIETEGLIKQLENILPSQIKKWLKYSAEQAQLGLSDSRMQKLYYDFRYIKMAVATPVDGYAGYTYKNIGELKITLKNLLQGILPQPLPFNLETLQRALKATERELTISRPPINLGSSGTIPGGSYQQQLSSVQDFITTRSNDIKMMKEDIRSLEKFPEGLDSTIQKYPDIVAIIGALLADILNLFSLVGPHECRDGENGVTLNEENCKCDICPPDKQLCEPIVVDPGIRLPWTALADSANYCLEPCCSDRVYKPTTIFNGGITELLGVPPCQCDCPGDLVLRPCESSSCEDGYICATEAFPDDQCTTLRIFSKFYWYDGSNDNDATCGFRCTDEQECGQYAKWDDTNTASPYCTCICQSKEEAGCPEKATYTVVDNYHLPPDFTGTYCDLLENPIEPQCTCVCEDRECPPGQTLNTSITGENACECVSDGSGISGGSGLSFIGQKTYYFDTESSSWKIID